MPKIIGKKDVEKGERRVRLALTLVTAAMVVALTGTASAFADVPSGFRVVNLTPVTDGVERFELLRDDPPLRVHVARIAPDAAVSLRAVLSNDAVAGED